MMWFDKDPDGVLFVDKRVVPKGAIAQQPLWSVGPDAVCDFSALPYRDDAFDLVVFDPPHAPLSPNSILGTKYGTLLDLDEVVAGLEECLRVASGFVVFKWAEAPFTIGEVLARTQARPLFGHRTAKSGSTIWAVFAADG